MLVFRSARRVETRRSSTAITMALVALIALAACGGSSDDDAASTTIAVGSDSEAEVVDTATGGLTDEEIGEIEGIEDLAGAIGGEELTDALDALGIDTRISVIADQLGGTYEVTSDTTAFLYLDGDAEFDGISVCFIVGAISSPGDRVVVVYPNGEVVCE